MVSTLQLLLSFLGEGAALGGIATHTVVSWERMQPWETQRLTQWSVFSREEGTEPLALMLVTDSIDGQCNLPFPKEQEQQQP